METSEKPEYTPLQKRIEITKENNPVLSTIQYYNLLEDHFNLQEEIKLIEKDLENRTKTEIAYQDEEKEYNELLQLKKNKEVELSVLEVEIKKYSKEKMNVEEQANKNFDAKSDNLRSKIISQIPDQN